MIKLLLLLCMISLGSAVNADEVLWPISIEIDQSSSFAEARGLRLHAGIDLRTRQTTGFPVRAIADGYISRVNVQFRGYGYAIYIDHPEKEIRVVYAHLRNFAGSLGEYVESKLQKMGARHGINDFFQSGRFPVKKGQVIGWTGESGSGPAHLHFEIRTLNDEPLAPSLYGYRAPDDIFPRMHNFYLEPMSYACEINGSFLPFSSSIKRNNKRSYAMLTTPVVSGEVAVKVGASDLNAVGNVFGVERIALFFDDNKLIERVFHRYSYPESRQAPWVFDYFKTSIRNTGYVYNMFKWPFETIPFASDYPAWAGLISMSADSASTHKLRVEAADYQNHEITLKGQLKDRGPVEVTEIEPEIFKDFAFDSVEQTTHSYIAVGSLSSSSTRFKLTRGTVKVVNAERNSFDLPVILNGDRAEIAFPKEKHWEKGAWIAGMRVLPEALFVTDKGGVVAMEAGGKAEFAVQSTHFPIFSRFIRTNLEPESGGNEKAGLLKPFSSIWSFFPNDQVFDKEVKIHIEPQNFSGDPQKLAVYSVSDSGRYGCVGGSFEHGALAFKTRVGGCYLILEDLIAPALSYARKGKDFHLGNVWVFKVSDVGRGVDYLSASATVDGKSVEVYSEPDKAEIYVVRPAKKGKYQVELNVYDYAKNAGTIARQLTH